MYNMLNAQARSLLVLEHFFVVEPQVAPASAMTVSIVVVAGILALLVNKTLLTATFEAGV